MTLSRNREGEREREREGKKEREGGRKGERQRDREIHRGSVVWSSPRKTADPYQLP